MFVVILVISMCALTSCGDDDDSNHEHSYQAQVIPPSCQNDGFTVYTCECGDVYIEDYIDKIAHTYTMKITEPTCTEQGYATFTCTCGDSYVSNYTDKIAHSYSATVTSPTCTEQGYTTYTCTCGDTYVDDYTDKIAHAYTPVVTEPTCTEQGYTTYTCSCGDSYVGDYTDKIAHSYASVVTEPTCTEQGYTTYTCSCGDSYVGDYTDKIAHTYTSVVTKPTCTEKGYTTYTCACGDTYVGDYTDKIAHIYTSVVTEPTCTEKGYTTYTCSCGDTYVDDYVDKTGHSAVDGICSVCGDIAATPDEYFTFTLLDDGTYSIAAKDVKNMPSVVIIPRIYNGKAVTSIGYAAFQKCSSITKIIIPNSVTLIEQRAFYNCSSLENIVVEKENPKYHSNENCIIETDTKTLIVGCKNSVIPADGSVTQIWFSAFSGCSSLTSIVIPDAVTSIGALAFEGCSSLVSVVIGDGITTILMGAFDGCTSLNNIVIPDNAKITMLAGNVFNGTAYYADERNWVDGVLYIGNHLIEAKSTVSGEYRIRVGTVTIATMAFTSCPNLTSIIIPDSVTGISPLAFAGNILENIEVDTDNVKYHSIDNCIIETNTKTLIFGCKNSTIPTDCSVTSIGYLSYYNRSDITQITIPNNITSIDNGAFSGCINLANISIHDNVTLISMSAFSSTAYYADVNNWVDGVLYIDNHLIKAKSTISGKYIVRNDVVTIAGGAFDRCNSITDVVVSDSVAFINDYAFYECNNLARIIIGNGIASIGNYAFYGCSNLTDVYYTGTEEEWAKITIGSDNEYLTNATIHYNYVPEE